MGAGRVRRARPGCSPLVDAGHSSILKKRFDVCDQRHVPQLFPPSYAPVILIVAAASPTLSASSARSSKPTWRSRRLWSYRERSQLLGISYAQVEGCWVLKKVQSRTPCKLGAFRRRGLHDLPGHHNRFQEAQASN